MKGVSIVIPTYNRERFISEAIESVLRQEFDREIEIIVTDDGSSDETLNIAKSFGNQVKVINKPKDCTTQGPSGTRNRGIAAATMPYLCFLDSDDFYLPEHLKKMISALESLPDFGFAFCKILEMQDNSSPKLFRLWSKEKITPRDIAHLIISKHNVIQTNGFIFKTEVFKSVGVFDESINHAEDIDLWMRISEKYRGCFSNHYGAVIRKHDVGQLTNRPKESLLKLQYTVFAQALKRYHSLNLNNKYRRLKLVYITTYYKVMQFPILTHFFVKLYRYKAKKEIQPASWFALDHFLP